MSHSTLFHVTCGLTGLLATATLTASGTGTNCSTGAKLKNTTAFSQPRKIEGLRCGVNCSGVVQQAHGTTTVTCS